MKIYGLLLAGLSVLAVPVAAQDLSAEPTYDTINLSVGFTPDPHPVAVHSGGSVDAGSIGAECSGFISDAPDVRLHYDAGQLPLTIGTIADGDTTLVINGPDGQWYCDDDSGGDGDALVHFADPDGGQYDIWVGSFDSGESHETILFMTETS